MKLMVKDSGDDTATSGSVPDISIYNADVSTADLSPGYNPFDSATGIATVADTVSHSHLRSHETELYLVCCLLLGYKNLPLSSFYSSPFCLFLPPFSPLLSPSHLSATLLSALHPPPSLLSP